MSRVGRMPIPVPAGVKVSIADGVFVADGPKGKVSERLLDGIPVEIEDGVVRVTRTSDSGELRSQHGLIRALLANAVQGVAEGFSKSLEIHGVGYRAEVKGARDPLRARLLASGHLPDPGGHRSRDRQEEQDLGERRHSASRWGRWPPRSARCASPSPTRARASGTPTR